MPNSTRKELETSLSNQRDHCNEKLRKLEADLNVRQKRDVNITNERWHQYINDLNGNHNLALQHLKVRIGLNYYICLGRRAKLVGSILL